MELIDDVPRRKEMSIVARARIEDELAWNHQSETYVGVYNRLLRSGSSATQGRDRSRRCRRRLRGPEVCGIAGCYQQTDGDSLARFMSDRIAHRGPDAEGLYAFNDSRLNVQLAHRRLSIIDLSAAADQPFTQNGLTISYNGELYNYKEIRSELAASGVQVPHDL